MQQPRTADADVIIASTTAVSFDSQQFFERFGPAHPRRALWKVLGYPTAKAMVMARRRGTVPVRLFEIPTRRGVFAYTEDVIQWFAQMRLQGTANILKEDDVP